MKTLRDLTPYANVLPYASEIFGVYQPLLGWRSEQTKHRFARGFAADKRRAERAFYRRFKGRLEIALDEKGFVKEVKRLEPGAPVSRQPGAQSFLFDALRRELPAAAQLTDAVWAQVLDPARIKKTLETVALPRALAWYQTASERAKAAGRGAEPFNRLFADQLSRESTLAGYLMHLQATKQIVKLQEVFFKAIAANVPLLPFEDPLDVLDPLKDIDRVGLSPIGIVHLFRQYFFELDTFLGSPVNHVWLSPGSTVELIEVQTRRTIVEKTFESAFETVTHAEKTTLEEDELSEAVKEENRSDTKFAVNATVSQSWVGGEATATASIDVANTQSKAREVTHRQMRQQTEKLSTEIRRNYKSTFKTVTETTDTSSKRYVLNNTTDALINYELRRKMRQVAVQVQDIGTYLCWQTYVDDPGRELGVSRLVHIAEPAETEGLAPPDSTDVPEPFVTEEPIQINFKGVTEDTIDEDRDEAYTEGYEVNLEDQPFEGAAEQIQVDFGPYHMSCAKSGFVLSDLAFDTAGAIAEISVLGEIDKNTPGQITFYLHLHHVNFQGAPSIQVVARATWVPDEATAKAVADTNAQRQAEFTERASYEYKKAFVEAARERVKLASQIEPRPFEDLREEERIVVYRSLIQGMLTRQIPMPDDRTRHAVAELLNAIFDVEKMLYFVAPEWWRPRLHRSHQALGGVRGGGAPGGGAPGGGGSTAASSAPTNLALGTVYGLLNTETQKHFIVEVDPPAAPIEAIDTVSWGSGGSGDDYYITDESAPAKLGSSLGWLLQLDGDNLRNAFLNAPWVKAVIPIRPGKERAAMNWLQGVHVEGTDGLDDKYLAPLDQLAGIPHEGPSVTIRDAINHLCDVVAEKHSASNEVGRHPTDEINDDNRVSSTPVDKVYEHGFYPLQGGFRAQAGGEHFEVFDQWIEVLPTDQIVPVEVTYDPKTGRQV